MNLIHPPALDPAKFRNPAVTAKGEIRASVPFVHLETLWFNTGTLCNIACNHCYIESSPENDRLAYLLPEDVTALLDQAEYIGQRPRSVAFTGGEPFMNPHLGQILDSVLERGYQALVLTNAMRPMMRPRVQASIHRCVARHGARFSVRVSLDHFSAALHDHERGPGAFAEAINGLRWLHDAGVAMTVAGRSCWDADESSLRAGYRQLFAEQGIPVDAMDPGSLLLFPEMDPHHDVPEITVDCWRILGRDPADMMCASSRMVVRRKDSPEPSIVACTLLPYEPEFDLGPSLADALRPVRLNHPHCARFCVLGGGSCTG